MTAKTGEKCPVSGVWKVDGFPTTTAPIAKGNTRLSCNSWGITLCNFPFMHTPLLIYTGRTSYLPLHEMKP